MQRAKKCNVDTYDRGTYYGEKVDVDGPLPPTPPGLMARLSSIGLRPMLVSDGTYGFSTGLSRHSLTTSGDNTKKNTTA